MKDSVFFFFLLLLFGSFFSFCFSVYLNIHLSIMEELADTPVSVCTLLVPCRAIPGHAARVCFVRGIKCRFSFRVQDGCMGLVKGRTKGAEPEVAATAEPMFAHQTILPNKTARSVFPSRRQASC
ncbi:hypothetical protein LX36DRAFT_251299 [Colletotrichum falcatum]|nr:hypothetical protein LX36DRAFT_251299 [Colletotrichum falcatum]